MATKKKPDDDSRSMLLHIRVTPHVDEWLREFAEMDKRKLSDFCSNVLEAAVESRLAARAQKRSSR